MRALLIAMLIATACGSRANAPAATPSASPSSAATASPSPSPTLKPNPTAGPATYTSLALAYRIDIPAGWRRSACQSTRTSAPPAVETFTSASVAEESGTDTGAQQDVVAVQVQDAAGQTALQFLESGKMGSFSGTRIERTTIDGKDAARMIAIDTGKAGIIAIAGRGRIYALSRGLRPPLPASEAAANAMYASIHILSDAELADAKATLATPIPAPARSAEEVADVLAKAFPQKDTAALATVSGECLMSAGENAGGTFVSASRYLANLAAGFANGLTVSVQARPLEDRQADYAVVRGTWTEGGTARNVKLMMRRIDNTWYWEGVLFLSR